MTEFERHAWIEGTRTPKVVCVLEAPSFAEINLDKPCTPPGPSGEVLAWACQRVGLSRRTNLLVLNLWQNQVEKDRKTKAIRERSTNCEYVDNSGNFTPAGREAAAWLTPILAQLPPEAIIVPMGGTATSYLVPQVDSIMKWRGSPLHANTLLSRRVLCVPTLHPAATLERGPEAKGLYIERWTIAADLAKALHYAEHGPPAPPEVIVPRKSTEALDYMRACTAAGRVATDLEIAMHYEGTSCFSLAYDNKTCMSVPIHTDGPYWSEQAELNIWTAYSDLLNAENVEVINQNLIFDLAQLDKPPLNIRIDNLIQKVKFGKVSDPMIGFNILYPDYRKGLGYIASLQTHLPYYKDDGKTWGAQRDWPKFLRYNALDAHAAGAAWWGIKPFDGIKADLRSGGYWPTYKRDMRKYPIMLARMRTGVAIDLAAVDQMQRDLEESIQAETAALRERVGHKINPNSSAAAARLFYDELGVKPFTKNGRPTLDKLALQRLVRHKRPDVAWLAGTIQSIRQKIKMQRSYAEVELDSDGRLRSSWNPRGTGFSRVSSSATIFGRGINMQTMPPPFRPLIVADPDIGDI